MPDLNPRAILNHLVETCKDGERGFRHAAGLVTHWAMQSEFTHAADQRAQFATDLLAHAQRLGGASTADGTVTASLHRHWMDVRSRLSGHDDRAILTEARRGDSVTVLAFKSAVEGALPETVRDLVEQEYTDVCRSHERLEDLDKIIQDLERKGGDSWNH